jgi:hypothetical protein
LVNALGESSSGSGGPHQLVCIQCLKIIGLRRKRFIQTAAHNFESATAEESRIIRYRGAFAWTLPENPSDTKPENETQDLYRGAADVSV